MNRNHDELVQMVRPPRRELPAKERQAIERQYIFREHMPGSVPRSAPNPRRQYQPVSDLAAGPVERPDFCILDERGGHRALGRRCPHFAGYDPDEVTEIRF